MKGAIGIACAAAALLAGCGGATMREQTTATAAKAEPPQDESHLEIARLEGRIAYRRDQLGLAPAEAPSNAAAAPSVQAPPASEEVVVQHDNAPPPPPPAPVMEARPSQAFSARASVEPEAAPPVRATRCKDVATAADEICDAAERICRLADQVADDPARASCGRAREDCKRAKSLSSGCR
jgi:hypothetical protein